jgi:DNA-binding beta-propeller fold protein YncE
MKKAKILEVSPRAAVTGGEVIVECENFEVRSDGKFHCYFNGNAGQIVGASANRVVALVPPGIDEQAEVRLMSGGELSNVFRIKVGEKLHDDLHLVANPTYSEADESLIVTRSGSRGQQLPVTLFRLRLDGELEEISGDVMNPTGVAFDPNGQLFVTSRAEGVVYRISKQDEALPFVSDLGIATGLAFNKRGEMFVGDRAGTIFRINEAGEAETFATLEPSIAAYHLAFGVDGALYVTRPNVASFDAVMRIDEDGEVSTFYRGLGRPQGLAFDRDGNLYVAASLRQRRGIVRITSDGTRAELYAAGMNIVGLCFGANGEMFVATNEAVFRLDAGIYGTLLD